MSINSIDHDDMTNIANKWDSIEEIESQRPTKESEVSGSSTPY